MNIYRASTLVPLAIALIACATPSSLAQSFTVLHTFSITGSDGSNPEGTLVRDNAGNLYGTTFNGGRFTNGEVFKLNKVNTLKILYSFPGGADGAAPAAGLILDATGNLYGAATSNDNGGGLIFEVSQKKQETVLYDFGNCFQDQPCLASGNLLRDSSGNIYGTTILGGLTAPACTIGCGTIFKLDSTGVLTVLYQFTGGSDGQSPQGSLITDAAGNFYGVALFGGDLNCPQEPTRGCGTVFKFAADGTFTVLYTFKGGSDGAGPQPGLVMDSAGNLYGAAEIGGNSNCDLGCGTLFKIGSDGQFNVLYSFTGAADGNYPNGSLVIDPDGNLYGTTPLGTTGSFYGTVYKLNTNGQMTVLHSLNGNTDGATPQGGLIRDSAGNLYGTAFNGFGRNDRNGTIFKETP